MSAPQYPQHPPQHGWHAYPPPRKKTNKALLLIPLILVLVAGGVTAAFILKPSNATNEPAQTLQSDGPPDEGEVLMQKISSGTVSYGAMQAFDACAVLPLSALKDLGVTPKPLGFWEHLHFPASVPAEDAKLTKVSDFTPASACKYPVPGRHDNSSFELKIAQAPFNARRGSRGSRDNETTTTVAGLRVITRDGSDPGSYFADIDTPDTTAELSGFRLNADYNGTPDKELFAKVAAIVATNLAKGPGERASHAFGGRYQNLPNACDVLSSELFKELAGEKDSGQVKFEPESNAERQADYKQYGPKLNMVGQKCGRKTAEQLGEYGDKGKSLAISLKTYRGKEQAEWALRFDCDPNAPSAKVIGEPMPVKEAVGDSPACVRPIETLHYLFRVDRTVVEIEVNKAWSGTSLGTFATEFLPIARKVADEVREFS